MLSYILYQSCHIRCLSAMKYVAPAPMFPYSLSLYYHIHSIPSNICCIIICTDLMYPYSTSLCYNISCTHFPLFADVMFSNTLSPYSHFHCLYDIKYTAPMFAYSLSFCYHIQSNLNSRTPIACLPWLIRICF